MLRFAVVPVATAICLACAAPAVGSPGYLVYLCSGAGADEPLGSPELDPVSVGVPPAALSQRCELGGEAISVGAEGQLAPGQAAGFALEGGEALQLSALSIQLRYVLPTCGQNCEAEAYIRSRGPGGETELWRERGQSSGGLLSFPNLGDATGLEFGIGCPAAGSACPAGSLLEIPLAMVSVVETAAPKATLSLPAGPLSGNVALHLEAADPGGGGLLGYRLAVDGAQLGETQPLADPTGRCRPLPYQSERAFSLLRPCPLTASTTVSVDTDRLTDGRHRLAAFVETVGGIAVAAEGELEAENRPIVGTPQLSGTPQVGQVVSAVEPPVAPRGGNRVASISRQWELCDQSGCSPIPGAEGRTYIPLPDEVGKRLRYALTATDGALDPTPADLPHPITVRSPESAPVAPAPRSCAPCAPRAAGSNRPWRVVLSIKPRLVRRHNWITIRGRVLTRPLPNRGKLVLIQARSVAGRLKGPWITFMLLRANRHGAFAARYRFRLGGRHTYQFRAVAPAEGLFRNRTGTSRPVTVVER